jgi:glycosyltransferase involved in cell wall biosynthesis
LVGQYPAVNHTFVLREVRALRAAGFDLRVASVLPCDRSAEKLSDEEREEFAQTFYVKPARLSDAFAPHLKTLAERPGRYLAALARTLLDCLAAPKSAGSIFLYFVEAVVLGRWLAGAGVGHVHSHFTSSVCLVASKIFPVSFSMTIHGPAEFEDAVGFRLGEKVRAARFVCAISSFARSQLMRYSDPVDWPKIEVSPLGVNPARFAPRPFRDGASPFEIVCVARLAPVKAQHVLLAAVARLAEEGRDVRLRLVGDGPLRPALEREARAHGIESRVSFEGWLVEEEVRRVLAGADAFALASFAEGVPVVLMEAMAMEIPCVATFVNGVPELIRHELGAAGRLRVIEKYDLARNAERLAEIFRRRLFGAAGVEAAPGSASVEAASPPAESNGGGQSHDTLEALGGLGADAGEGADARRGEGERMLAG